MMVMISFLDMVYARVYNIYVSHVNCCKYVCMKITNLLNNERKEGIELC